ncbi:hypothetical protein H9Q72_009340 [Fusarium xylarioides]|uniref:Uncharacterized protein n=1 Tax=Fusarium xylarioides TaxID=221167 RepID=A0A9P7HUU7_9HYPO|nr:hypothetical protein H9Q70_009852 [Fusarium xylarioides]KAG5762558.1 hypothetical protein H9Q72_009340 [Fusarium xylarioides]
MTRSVIGHGKPIKSPNKILSNTSRAKAHFSTQYDILAIYATHSAKLEMANNDDKEKTRKGPKNKSGHLRE